MTIKQKTRLRMYLAVRNFVSNNESAVKSMPKFAASFTVLLSLINEIQKVAELQEIDRTGVTVDKNKLKRNLITIAARNSRRLAALAKFENNDTLLSEIRFNESDLQRFPETTLREKCQTIYERGQANIERLADTGITADSQKEFLDMISQFNNILVLPRTTRAERKNATLKLESLFGSADHEIELMDFAAGLVEEDNIDFFNGYRSNRKLVDINGGKVSLKAKAIEISTGRPVKGVLFTFLNQDNGSEPSHATDRNSRRTAAGGSLRMRSLKAGTYLVKVAKPGYRDKELTVYVSDGERSDITVSMEKIEESSGKY
jgi:hypothetical protein